MNLHITPYEFFKQYVVIKNIDGTTRKPNEAELKEMEHYSEKILSGHRLQYIRNRNSNSWQWVKINQEDIKDTPGIELGERFFVHHKGCMWEIIFLEPVDYSNMYVFLNRVKVKINHEDLFKEVPHGFQGQIVYLKDT